MPTASSSAAALRRPVVAVVAATTVVVLLIVGWWWWPSFAGDGDDTDVVVVGDAFLQSVEPELSNRIHEDGLSVAGPVEISDWCEAPAAIRDAVADSSPSRVVVSAATEGSCGIPAEQLRQAVVDAAGGARTVVVVPPGGSSATAAALGDGGAVVVDPTRLLGSPDTLTQPCQWWDACSADGTVAVRDGDGTLSQAGATRVARMTVAALR